MLARIVVDGHASAIKDDVGRGLDQGSQVGRKSSGLGLLCLTGPWDREEDPRSSRENLRNRQHGPRMHGESRWTNKHDNVCVAAQHLRHPLEWLVLIEMARPCLILWPSLDREHGRA